MNVLVRVEIAPDDQLIKVKQNNTEARNIAAKNSSSSSSRSKAFPNIPPVMTPPIGASATRNGSCCPCALAALEGSRSWGGPQLLNFDRLLGQLEGE
jgi:hypothetical protein